MITYGYDSLDRLTSAILPASNYGYSYDAVGNRLTKTTGANTDTCGNWQKLGSAEIQINKPA